MATTVPAAAQRARSPRWGLRTLGFLGLVIVALVVAGVQSRHTFGTAGCVVFGIAGAAWCSVRGMRSLSSLEWVRRRP